MNKPVITKRGERINCLGKGNVIVSTVRPKGIAKEYSFKMTADVSNQVN